MDKKEYTQWLANLQIGDEVHYSSSGRYNSGKIVKVKRFTPSRMIGLSDGTMTNQDGSIRGDKYFSIHPVTQKHRDENEMRLLLHKIAITDFRKLSLDKLRAINKVLTSE